MGLSAEALRAGYQPKKMPVAAEKPKPRNKENAEMEMGQPWLC
jgi:hypothetical protein